MGVSLTALLNPKPLSLDDLKGKVVAIDAFNFLYQFLSSLRGPDGQLLTDSKGRVTSHLMGIFSRTSRLLEKNVKVIFVFDGEAPELKKKERERRAKLKEAAIAEYEIAKEREDVAAMRRFASRTTRITEEMITDAKKLITALGVPYIEAPSEGEAQAAFMSLQGDVDYVASQDTDAFLFGAPKVIRNLSILGKRKKISKLTYETVSPELIELDSLLNSLSIDRKQLIALSMLVGTDFNVGGIKGLGPQKGLKLVKEHTDLDTLFKSVAWDHFFDYSWKEVYDIFDKMPYLTDYKLEWKQIDSGALTTLLCDEYEFSRERVSSTLNKLKKATSSNAQTGLSGFM